MPGPDCGAGWDFTSARGHIDDNALRRGCSLGHTGVLGLLLVFKAIAVGVDMHMYGLLRCATKKWMAFCL